jgi:hypothetical protein
MSTGNDRPTESNPEPADKNGGLADSYMGDPLSDPVASAVEPYEIARVRSGQVAIANADAAWTAFAHAAIDQAHRAVSELLDHT